MAMTKYYTAPDGGYIGAFEGADPPEGSIEVPYPPPYAGHSWVNEAWQPQTQAKNAKLQSQIEALERKALADGLVRTNIDDLLIRSLAIATAAGVTEAQLLDPQSEHYSRSYEKVHANKTARDLLRSQKA